ncbi:hypothetical protein [Pararhizobium haloflavum]|uniref:hypothetical protein n=1 Tax=Pararhizobium haloflavum TaxID=2037914 RepID=UPI0013000C78|nr:hypothetical protein [Pararhizobium haloflavum]
MHLPPVDEYRAPFIEPLGHLAMQAAYADNNLINLCAVIPFEGSPNNLAIEVSAAELRNWNRESRQFVRDRIALISQPDLRQSANALVDRFSNLRMQRHRAIHDAIDVGLFGNERAGYYAKPLAIEYAQPRKEPPQQRFNAVTPDKIAALACEFYELQKDLDMIAFQLDRC